MSEWGTTGPDSGGTARPERRPCRGTAKRGPCKAFALPESDYCLSHDPAQRERMRAVRAKGGAVSSRLRVLQGKRRKLDTPAELIAFTAGVVQDILGGSVAPDIGRTVLYGVSIQKSLVEAGELERRLEALEQAASANVRRPAWQA